MKISSNEELLEVIGEAFLWDVISDHVEHDLTHIKEALHKIGYIDQEMVEQIAWAEIQESDEFNVIAFHEYNGMLRVSFEMPALINTQNSSGDWLFRITTFCTGTVEIPDVGSFDWNSLDLDDMDRPTILSHKDLAKNINVVYEEQDTEADDLTV